MAKIHKASDSKKISTLALCLGLSGSLIFLDAANKANKVHANPSMFEYRWDNNRNYKRLYYWQSSKEKRNRSTYLFVLRPTDRRTAILKLKITFPDYFDAKIKENKLALCNATLGGMLAKTKCTKKLPAIFEISKDQSFIEIFPKAPIPVDGTYAIQMKIFNPNQAGMFQLNATAQSPGDLPISSYIGSWNIDIE